MAETEPSRGPSLTEDMLLEKGKGLVQEPDPRAAGEVDPETQDNPSHRGLPVQDGGPEDKKILWSQLQKLKFDLSDEMRKLQDQEQANAAELEAKVQLQRDRIAREFEALHLYLEEEKSRLLSRLEQEKEEVLQMSLEKVAQLEERNASLTKLLSEIEEKSQRPDTELQQEWQKALRRILLKTCNEAGIGLPRFHGTIYRYPHQYPLSRELRFKSFGEVKQRLRSKEQAKMLQCFSQESTDMQRDIIESLEWRRARHFSDDVILDSESAHPQFRLSEDHRSVKMGRSHQSLPDSPERFDGPCVLGRSRFTSGYHYWEVKVEHTREWILGVCYESVNRKAAFAPSPESGYWAVGLWDGYRALNTAYPGTALKPRVRPTVVGVFLNYDMGRITFYNVGDRSQLYSFPLTHFHDTLRPVLCMWDTVTALQILSVAESQ